MMKKFQEKLKQLKDQNRFRSFRVADGIDLTSNDYLGMAQHPKLREHAIEFLKKSDSIGSGGSRLLRGHTPAHEALEEYASYIFSAPKSVYFSSGYQANNSIFQALPTRHDTIIFDEFVHASAREAIQNSPARRIKARHNDLVSFENALKEATVSEREQIWIAVESVYSMDGDVAPLKALHDLAEIYNAILIVDEAHGTGVMGPGGLGLSEDLIAEKGYEHLVVLHTCGKSLGVAGGLVCASQDIIEMITNFARGFIYTTAPMPVQAYLVQKSLELVVSDEGQARRNKLLKLSEKAHALFKAHGNIGGTHIVPILLGEDSQAVRVAQALGEQGYDIRAIRPPTVPEGTARLRLSLSSALDENILEKFAGDLEPHLNRKAA
ncbi:MAG: 8-amino-7-oxononanoate synthase [Pseudomonadota bacterium]